MLNFWWNFGNVSVFQLTLIESDWWRMVVRICLWHLMCKYKCKCLRCVTWNFWQVSKFIFLNFFLPFITIVWNEPTVCFRVQGQLYKHSCNQRSTLHQLVLVKERQNIQWLRKLGIQYSKDFNKLSNLFEIKYL